MSVQVRGHFKGFEILTRASSIKDTAPDLYIRGKQTYKANLNLENPLGTIASIEHTLRSLDRHAESEQREIQRNEKAMADYSAQLNRPFEHADRLKELISQQPELNALLDLDKSDAQAVGDTPDQPTEVTQPAPVPFPHTQPEPTIHSPPAAIEMPAQGLADVIGLRPRSTHYRPEA